jgi:hypothetical protein
MNRTSFPSLMTKGNKMKMYGKKTTTKKKTMKKKGKKYGKK